MKITGGKEISVLNREDEKIVNKLKRKNKVPNPVYYRNNNMGVSNKGVPEFIDLFREEDGVCIFPRNLKLGSIDTKFKDERVEGERINFSSKIKLTKRQEEAVGKLVKVEDGILVAPTGSGKTYMGVEAISRIGRKAVILVHKGHIANQWAECIEENLGFTPGKIQGDIIQYDKPITICMLQTLYSKKDYISSEFLNSVGLVVSDEVHRISAPTWAYVISMFPGKRRWGLTATPERADGLEFIFKAHMGDIVYTMEVDDEDLVPNVYMVVTDTFIPFNQYKNKWNSKPNRAKYINCLVKVEDRNKKIIKTLLDAARAGRNILVLSDRVNHLQMMKKSLDLNQKDDDNIKSIVYTSQGKDEAYGRLNDVDVIFSTYSMSREGLNVPKLDTLMMTTPCGHSNLQQAVGRILRVYEDKKTPLVIDFVDKDSFNAARRRKETYEDLGFPVKVIDKER